jgi:ParB family chromosome partitioning protein
MGKQALQGKRKDTFLIDPTELVIIGLDTKDGPEHPLYDRRILKPVPEACVANVEMEGVIKTVDVVKVDGVPLVTDGRQRVRWAREANKRRAAMSLPPILVPVSVVSTNDEGAVRRGISANSNWVRETPLDQAYRIEKFLKLGGTKTEAMTAVGAPNLQTVDNLLRLLLLPETIRDQVDRGEVSVFQALGALKSGEVTSSMAPNKPKEKAKPLTPSKRGRPAGPTKPTMKRILDSGKTTLPPSFVLAIRWCLGEVSDEQAGIAGLVKKGYRRRERRWV